MTNDDDDKCLSQLFNGPDNQASSIKYWMILINGKFLLLLKVYCLSIFLPETRLTFIAVEKNAM